MVEKIVRSLCLFSEKTTTKELGVLDSAAQLLQQNGFVIQTKRICFPSYQAAVENAEHIGKELLVGCGSLLWQDLKAHVEDFLKRGNISLTLDLTHESISQQHIEPLFTIIDQAPQKTFPFAFGFNLPHSSPFFPSARFGKSGFSVGLQSLDLSEKCSSVEEWFSLMKATWNEIDALLSPFEGYLGIDSSVAPLFSGKSSFVNLIRRLGCDFSHSVTTDLYTRISSFIKTENPRPVGLCGLMFPCVEDFELAEEYERGNFTIERNIFLSLHSGLGIDVYPIGIDQDKQAVVGILRLVQALSNKYQKPLAIRFVSDGKGRIGDRLSMANKYLKDVTVRKL